MRDLKADWRRWTRVERIVAVFIAFGMSSMVPALVRGAKGRAAAFDGRAVRGRMIAVFGPVRQIESG